MGNRVNFSILVIVMLGVFFIFGATYVSAFDHGLDIANDNGAGLALQGVGTDVFHQAVANEESNEYEEEEGDIDEELESDEGDDDDNSSVDEGEEGDEMGDEEGEDTTAQQE